MDEKKLDRIIQNQESQEKMVTQLLQIVGATNARVVNLEKSNDEIKETLARHEELLTKLVESKEKQDQMLENHDHLIELLSSRSIKQESEMKVVKRDLIEQDEVVGALATRSIEQEGQIKEIQDNKDKEAS